MAGAWADIVGRGTGLRSEIGAGEKGGMCRREEAEGGIRVDTGGGCKGCGG